jgi:hypothetical protein
LRVKWVSLQVINTGSVSRLHKSKLYARVRSHGLHENAVSSEVSVVFVKVLFQEVEECDLRNAAKDYHMRHLLN